MSSAIDILINATDQASKVLEGVGDTVKDMESAMDKAKGSSMVLMGAVTGAALGVIALGGNAVSQLGEIERIAAQTDAVIKSTGGVANVTADEIATMAVEMQYLTSVEHEAIRKGANLLLTFTNIKNEVGEGNDIFNRSTQLMTDLSVAMGVDTKGAATMLGKALNDPTTGMTALSRVGVSFTEEQKEQVKALQESGDMLGAQKVILNELEVQYGGSAEALGGTFVGQLTMAKMAFDDVWQAIMDQLGALEFLKNGLKNLTDQFLDFGGVVADKGIKEALLTIFPPETHGTIAMIAGAILVGLVPALYAMAAGFWAAIAPLIPFLAIGALVGALVYTIYQNWDTFAPYFQGIFETVKTFAEGFKEGFMTSFNNLLASLAPLWETVKTLLESLMPVLEVIGAVLGIFLTVALSVFSGVVNALGPLVTAFVNLLDVVVNVFMAIISILTGDFDKARQYWTKATESSIEFFKNLWEGVKSFFSGFISTFLSILKGFGVDLVASFQSMMSDGKRKVSEGVANIIKAVLGFASTFLDAGKGLLESFTKGVAKGIAGAISAVKEGMGKIRDFLPFSPAKKGPLSDLDKSGESFFPTWYEGALTQVRSMERAIGGAMSSLNGEMEREHGSVGLEAFTGGRSSVVVTHRHQHSGRVEVEGDNSAESVKFVGDSVQTRTESDFLDGFRQAVRKN